MTLSTETKNRISVCLFILFLTLGILARVWQFGALPADINQDEAFAGYTAFSLLKYGIDTSSYRFPVYLTAWGSGMNALNTYLMIPFVAVFGLKAWVIRLPQLIVGVLSLPVLYDFVRRIYSRRAALIALCILSLCPWHIMLSRWGLESNLAPGFMLFALYFFVRAPENERFLLLSALMYGLLLYTYATVWPFVPFMLLLQGIYCIRKKALRFDAVLIASVFILAVFAFPLMLFLLVNYGLVPEIRLPFLSIPKLLYMRSGEISFRAVPQNFINLIKILVLQTDGLPWNSTAFGLLYRFTCPFSVLGILCLMRSVIRSRREFDYSVLVLISLLAAVMLGVLIDINANRVNIIFIPLIICAAVGIDFLCSRLHSSVFALCTAAYISAFLLFSVYYFNDYQKNISYYFAEGLESAVADVADHDGPVYVTDRIYYPSLLFYTQEDVNTFIDTVEYRYYPAAFLKPASFDKYIFFDELPEADVNAEYIVPASEDISEFISKGYTAQRHGWFITLK